MKIPSNCGPISIHESQEAAITAKGSWTDSKAIHNIDDAKVQAQQKQIRDKATLDDQPKVVLLCVDIADQKLLSYHN